MNTRIWVMALMLVGMIGLVIPMGSASLSDDLIAYYNMDGLTSTIFDSLGNYDGTNQGTTRGAVGIIDTCNDYSNDYLDGFGMPLPANPFSIGVWIWKDGNSGTDYGIQQATSIFGHYRYAIITVGDKLQIRQSRSGSADATGSTSISTDAWHYVVLVSNSTGYFAYLDGAIEITKIDGTALHEVANQGLVFGQEWWNGVGQGNYWDGRIDEVGFWERALSQAEILELYNSGAGNTYPFAGEVTLYSPVDNYVTVTTTITFNATARSNSGETLVNMSLWTDETGSWEVRETTSITGTENATTWARAVTENPTIWAVEACDTTVECFFSENRTIIVDDDVPNILIDYPINGTIFSGVWNVGDTQDINITITDANLESCWYEYNGVNTTFGTGGVCNNFSITLENIGTSLQTITIWANDTALNTNSNSTYWGYEVLAIDATYPQTYNGNYSVSYTNWGAGEPSSNIGYGAYSRYTPGTGTWDIALSGQGGGDAKKNSICEYGDGQAYYYNSEIRWWNDARGNCHSKGWGWHLVQIDSEEEKDLIKEFQTETGTDIWLNLEYNYNNDWTTWSGSFQVSPIVFPMYYNETIETSSAYFRTNVTTDGSKTIQSVKLYMNSSELGTRTWTSTINDFGGNVYSFENTIDIPVITGTAEEEGVGYDIRSFYHEITYTDSSTDIIAIREDIFVELLMGICHYPSETVDMTSCPSGMYSLDFFAGECFETYDLSNEQGSGFFLTSLVFFNETATQESVNATFTWTLQDGYLGSGDETRTFILYQTTEQGWNTNSTICTNAWDYMEVGGTTRIQYENSESPQRTYQTTDAWDNFRTNTTLWLLPTSLGFYVTTIIENILQQAIQGATITWTREGFSGIVEQSSSDAAGSATFWLNPNFVYTISILKTGVGSATTTLTPTQSIYTFILGETTNVTTDYRDGVSITFEPLDYYLNNDTIYEFNMTINSSLYDLDGFGFSITELNGSVLASATGGSLDAGVDGFVTTSFNVGSPRKIMQKYYYNQNGTDYNYTKFYLIVDLSNTDYSIQNFFDLLKSYLNPDNPDDRIFGMSDLSFSILLFLIIFSIIGTLSYASGLYSPVALSAISFTVVMLFDVVLGLIPQVNNMSYVPTVLMLIIMFGVVLWETGGKN